MAALGKELPTKWRVNGLVPTAISFDRTRLDTGVFIVAGETLYDWSTSYDQLDIIKHGITAVGRRLMKVSYDPEQEEDDDSDPQPDYLAFINEFRAKKRDHKEFKRIPNTESAETAHDRREREDVHMFSEPSSPIDSPPNSPMHNTNIPSDIPSTHPNYRMYRAKFGDHHGVLFKQWPELGLNVPYSP